MTQDIKTCPTCGQKVKSSQGIFSKALFGGIIGIVFGILLGYGFSIWWFGPDMHFTPMAIIHYFAWGILFGFIGSVIGLLIRS